IVLIGIALFQVFEAEIGSEETCGAILKRNTLIASYSRAPHPLIARAVRMIYDQKPDSLHLRGSSEAQNRFAVSERTYALEHPALGCHPVRAACDFECPFVALGCGGLAALNFFENRARVLRESNHSS